MSSVSIYILTYNRAEFLREAIESVLGQEYRDFNLYILDNHSEDNTSEVVGSFNDERIHYIRHKENIGGINNINFAMDHCKSDYYVIFHDDDVMLPNLIRDELNYLENNKDIAAVSGQTESMMPIKENGNTTHSLAEKCYSGNECWTEYFSVHHYFVFPSIMYRTTFMNEHNIRLRADVGPCCDVVLYFDIERCGGAICELSNKVMNYRVHDGQDSSINKYPMHVKLFNFLSENEDYKDLYEEAKVGRILTFIFFSRLLFWDYVYGLIDEDTSIGFYHQLKNKLKIEDDNKWYHLSKIAMKVPFGRYGMRFLNSVKNLFN